MNSSPQPTDGGAHRQAPPGNRTAVGWLGALAGVIRQALSLPWHLEARLRGVEMRGKVVFLGRPVLTMAPGSRMILHGGNWIASSTRCTGLGNIVPCVLRTLAPGAQLELGLRVGLSGASLCAASSITIGEGTLVGAGAMIFDTDFHRPEGGFGWSDEAVDTARPISIGRGCFIGTRAIVLKGVKMADRSAAAAGAVVTCNVPTGFIAVGNPARLWPWQAAGGPDATVL